MNEHYNLQGLVNKLTGKINPIGSTHVDIERLKNLEIHIALIEALIIDLVIATEEDLSGLASVDESNKRIKMAMKDLKAMIERNLSEEE